MERISGLVVGLELALKDKQAWDDLFWDGVPVEGVGPVNPDQICVV